MLTYRKYNPDDKPSCIALLQKGHDPRFTPERFDWLHHRNIMAPSDIALAVDGSTVVGFYAALKKHIIIEGTRYIGARDIDPVVSRDYRGQGIFTRLLDFALNEFTDIDFFYNFANPASTPGFLKMGWQQIGPLRDYVCQTGFEKLLSKESILYLVSCARTPRHNSVTVREIFINGPESEPIFNPLPPEGKIWVDRSIPYLQWRYFRNPLHNYTLTAAFTEDTMIKLCITRFLPDKNHLLIIDFLSSDGNYSLLEFLPFWKRKYNTSSVYLWHTMPKSCLHCFVTNPSTRGKGQNFLVRGFPGKHVPETIFNLNNWYLTRGDSEVF